MKDYDYKNILTVLTEASPAHLALASFVVFPVVLSYWLDAILKLFPDLSADWKLVSIIALIVMYLVCLTWLALDAAKKRSLELMRDLILGRLTANNWTAMGFDSARQVLGDDCKDEKIHRVIQAYPKTLRFVKLKLNDEHGAVKDEAGNVLYKPGVALVHQGNI